MVCKEHTASTQLHKHMSYASQMVIFHRVVVRGIKELGLYKDLWIIKMKA